MRCFYYLYYIGMSKKRLEVAELFTIGKVIKEKTVKVAKEKTVRVAKSTRQTPQEVAQKEQELLQATNSREFIKVGKQSESGDALIVAEWYEKLVNRQEKQLRIYEKEHGKSMTNQDIEGIEARVTKQIELLTALYEQGRVSEYSMRFGADTLAQAKQYGRNRTQANESEDNKRGVINTVSLSVVEDIIEDATALQEMQDTIDQHFMNSLLQANMNGDDYLFCIDYIAGKIDKSNVKNRLRMSETIEKQKEKMKRYRWDASDKKTQG